MSTKPESGANSLSGHRARLRSRLERDPLSLADHEVMELLLGLAIPRKDTKILAHELLDRFQGMRGALDARDSELLGVPGFGTGTLSLWKLLREVMARRASAPLRRREVLASPQAVADMAKKRLGFLPEEETWLALVDARNHLIAWDRLRKGGVSSVAIEPRDILESALLRKASGLILVHNHPGGDARPSRDDIVLTDELKSLSPRLGLRFLDHVIVTSGECYSICLKRFFDKQG